MHDKDSAECEENEEFATDVNEMVVEMGRVTDSLKKFKEIFKSGGRKVVEDESRIVDTLDIVGYPAYDGIWESGDTTFRAPKTMIGMWEIEGIVRISDVLQVIFRALKDEIFRNGLTIEPRYKSKCTVCEREYDTDMVVCEACGGVTKEPNEWEYQKLRRWIEEEVNSFGQNLIQVLQEVELDIEKFDNGFVYIGKRYYYDKKGRISAVEVKEISRASPYYMRKIYSRYGMGRDENGNYLYVCPQHREQVETFKEEGVHRCKQCGKEMLPAHFVEVKRGINTYYAKGEIWHGMKYEPSVGYGMSRIYYIWPKVVALYRMDMFIKKMFELQRSPRGLLFLFGRRDSIRKAWKEMLMYTRQNPNMIYPIAIEDIEGGSGKEIAKYIDLSPDFRLMQFIETREEFRRVIGMAYGVSPMFQGDMSVGGGLSVLPDTPVVIRRNKKWIDIVPIASLHTAYMHKINRYGLGNIEVLTKDGWSKIKATIRQRKKKKGYRVVTGDSFVEISEDHSIFLENGKEVKGSELKKGDRILLYDGNEYQEIGGKVFSDDFAYAVGLFLAEGSAFKSPSNHGGYRYTVEIYNDNVEYLERAKRGIDAMFGANGRIRRYKEKSGITNRLEYNNEEIYRWFKKNCYSEWKYAEYGSSCTKELHTILEKKVPIQILNADKETKEEFLKGYMDGDGYIATNGKETSFRGIHKTLVAGIKWLFNELGKESTVNFVRKAVESHKNQVRVRLIKSKRKTPKNKIKELIEFEEHTDWYDISTENGNFVGGIGLVVLHNSNEGLQITITNRVVASGQALWNNDFFEFFMRQLGVKDWKIQLLPNEEKDMKAQIERETMRMDLASRVKQLGYDIEIIETDDGLDFTVGERVEQGGMGGFGGLFGGGETGIEGEPQEEGERRAYLKDFEGMPEVREGLDITVEGGDEELDSFFQLEKKRVYVKSPSEAPKGVQLKRGPRGGLYYEVDEKTGKPKTEAGKSKTLDEFMSEVKQKIKDKEVAVEEINEETSEMARQVKTIMREAGIEKIMVACGEFNKNVTLLISEDKREVMRFHFMISKLLTRLTGGQVFLTKVGRMYGLKIMTDKMSPREFHDLVETFSSGVSLDGWLKVDAKTWKKMTNKMKEAFKNTFDMVKDDLKKYGIRKMGLLAKRIDSARATAFIHGDIILFSFSGMKEIVDSGYDIKKWKEDITKELERIKKKKEKGEYVSLDVEELREKWLDTLFNTVEHTFFHECGHHIFYSLIKDLNDEELQELLSRLSKNWKFSLYTQYACARRSKETCASEVFAEVYATYKIHSEYLKFVSPDMYEFMEEKIGSGEVELGKERVYIDSPEEAPEGAEVKRGPKGGLYYEIGERGEKSAKVDVRRIDEDRVLEQAKKMGKEEFEKWWLEDYLGQYPRLSKAEREKISMVVRGLQERVGDEMLTAEKIWRLANGKSLSLEEGKIGKIAVKYSSYKIKDSIEEEDKNLIMDVLKFVSESYPDEEMEVYISDKPVSLGEKGVMRIGIPPDKDFGEWCFTYLERVKKGIDELDLTDKEKWVAYDVFHELGHVLGISDEEEADRFALKMARKWAKVKQKEKNEGGEE